MSSCLFLSLTLIYKFKVDGQRRVRVAARKLRQANDSQRPLGGVVERGKTTGFLPLNRVNAAVAVNRELHRRHANPVLLLIPVPRDEFHHVRDVLGATEVRDVEGHGAAAGSTAAAQAKPFEP